MSDSPAVLNIALSISIYCRHTLARNGGKDHGLFCRKARIAAFVVLGLLLAGGTKAQTTKEITPRLATSDPRKTGQGGGLLHQKTAQEEKSTSLRLVANSGLSSYVIYDIWWENALDVNGDGYTQYRQLYADVDAADGGSHNIYLAIYSKLSTSSTWSPYFTTPDYIITGTSGGDAIWVTVGSPNPEMSMNMYDFKVEVYEAGKDTVQAAGDPSTNLVLNAQLFETAAEDARVATPVISPTGGNIPITATIACGTPGASIRYTLDGTDPTSSSTLYSGPIQINSTSNVVLKAQGFKSGLPSSAVAIATFAYSSQPLEVVTLAATILDPTTVQLNGTVNPHGLNTMYYFECGTTTSYGTQTTSASAGSATSATAVSATLSGLTAGMLYHDRLVATNSAGTSLGNDMTFTIPVQRPAVVSLAATNVTLTTAQLNGTVNPNGLNTTYYFVYGTTASYGTQSGGASAGSGTSATNVSVTLSGLTSGTLYHYRVVATNSAGTSQGTDITLTTTTAAQLPAVVALAATNVTLTTAQLNGTINPNGAPTTYYFVYGTTADYGLTTSRASIGTGTSAINVSATVTGLTPGTTYHYTPIATNSAGDNWGSDVTFTMSALAPEAVTLAATNLTPNAAQLNGTVNPHGSSATYYFEYGATTSYGSQTSSFDAGSGTSAASVSVSVVGLTPYTPFHFRIVATNSFGMTFGNDETLILTAAEDIIDKIPTAHGLGANYPNPFNPTTAIPFALPDASHVTLKVYDLLGRELATLVSQDLVAGYYSARWYANVSSGIYVYRIEARDASTGSGRTFVASRTMTLIK